MTNYPSAEKMAKFPSAIINDCECVLPSWWGEPVNELGAKVSVVYDAFVSSGSIDGWPANVLSTVESSAWESVRDADFYRISKISKPPSDVAAQRGAVQRLSGDYVYLGWLFGHYGHFLLESLSRFWYCVDRQCPSKYLVHSNYSSFSEFPKHVVASLKAFGINASNLTIVKSPVVVDRLHCPSQAIRCDHSSGRHLAYVYRNILTGLGLGGRCGGRAIYLSRRSMSVDPRSFNEVELEGFMASQGFEIVAPEVLPFDRQLEIFSQASVMVGPAGSAMHNAVFASPSARVLIIAPNNFLFKNDVLLSLACGHSVDYHITRASDDAVVRHVPWNLDVAAFADSFLNWL